MPGTRMILDHIEHVRKTVNRNRKVWTDGRTDGRTDVLGGEERGGETSSQAGNMKDRRR